MKKIYLVILFCSSALYLFGQSNCNITISKDTLYIGEAVQLNISLSLPQRSQVKEIGIRAFDSIASLAKTSSIPDSMLRETFAEIEWPEGSSFKKRSIPVSEFDKAGNLLQKDITIRFWDIGIFKLPQIEIFLDSSAQNFTLNHFETPTVYVLPPEGVQPIDTTQMLMPISNIIIEGKTWEDFVWIAYLLFFLITMALVIWMVRRSRNKETLIEEEVVKVIRPAHELSLEKLSSLKNKELWQQGKIKEYQSELTYIIREYLENRFDIQALESTTDEIVRDLKDGDFDMDQEQSLKEILQIADLVKFAKATPASDVHDKFMNQAVDFVEQTKKLIEKLENDDGLVQ